MRRTLFAVMTTVLSGALLGCNAPDGHQAAPDVSAPADESARLVESTPAAGEEAGARAAGDAIGTGSAGGAVATVTSDGTPADGPGSSPPVTGGRGDPARPAAMAPPAATPAPMPGMPAAPHGPKPGDGRASAAPAAPEPAPAKPDGGFRADIQSGTLTAGSFDDFDAPSHYRKLAGEELSRSAIASLAREFATPPIVLTVVNGKKLPVAGAAVSIKTTQGRTALQLTTRTDGKVVIMPGWDGFADADRLVATVTPPDGSEAVTTNFALDAGKLTITLPKAASEQSGSLDLAFIVDCTGSMSDELEYLKVEVKSIVAAIRDRFPGLKMRFGLVVYRDKGDEYVTRSFDFVDTLDAFEKNLGAQRANGGGDEPEAVDEAFKVAGQLRWSEKAETARVAFHIADAPPHDELCRDALKQFGAIRGKGVAVYPVASSGVHDVAEFTMRTEALLTGCSYVFLTDDSGVGNAHAEPHFPEYHVERLDKLMIRLIASELSGRRIQASPEDIIRKTG